MSGKVAPTAALLGALPITSPGSAGDEVRPVRRIPQVQEPATADLRLIIEEGDEPGGYVYTVVDQRSGKVVSRLPREAVLRMRDNPLYKAGSIYSGDA